EIAWPVAPNLPGIHGRAVNVVADNAMGRCGRAGNAALDLRILDALGQGRKRLRRLIARLHVHGSPIDGTAVEPWRCPRLEPTKRKSKTLQRQSKINRRRLADTARRRRSLPHVNEAPPKGPPCQHHTPPPPPPPTPHL